MASPYDLPFQVGVVTYNTHLFGDTMDTLVDLMSVAEILALPITGNAGYSTLEGKRRRLLGLKFRDDERASAIGAWLAKLPAAVDVVGLCEVWDTPRKDRIVRAAGARFPHVCWPAPDPSLTKPVGSGLLLLSRYPLEGARLVGFENRYGYIERASDKGFIHAVITPRPGRSIAIYMTHTQAMLDDDPDEHEQQSRTRDDQIAQIRLHRRDHYPDLPAIFMGDMNVASTRDTHRGNSQWGRMLEVLNAEDCFRELHPIAQGWTYRQHNSLVERMSKTEGIAVTRDYRYDYVLVDDSSGQFALVPVKAEVRPCSYLSKTLYLGSLDARNGYQDASDHDPVMVVFEATKTRVRGFTWSLDSTASPIDKPAQELIRVQNILADWMSTARLAFAWRAPGGTPAWIRIVWKPLADDPTTAFDETGEPAVMVPIADGIELQFNPARAWRLSDGNQKVADPTRHTFEAWAANNVGLALNVPEALHPPPPPRRPFLDAPADAVMHVIDDYHRPYFSLKPADRWAAEAVYGRRDRAIDFAPPGLDFAAIDAKMAHAVDELGHRVIWQAAEGDSLDAEVGRLNKASLTMKLEKVEFRKNEDTVVGWLPSWLGGPGHNEFKIYWGAVRLGPHRAEEARASGSIKTRSTVGRTVGIGETWKVDVKPSLLRDPGYDVAYGIRISCVGKDDPDPDDKLGSAEVYDTCASWGRKSRNLAEVYREVMDGGGQREFREDFTRTVTCKKSGKWVWRATLTITLYVPQEFNKAYTSQQAYRARSKKEVAAFLKKVRAGVGTLTGKLPAALATIDRARPRHARAAIAERVEATVVGALQQGKFSLPERSARGSTKRLAALINGVRNRLVPAAGARERAWFDQQVELHIAGVAEHVLHQEGLHTAAGPLRRALVAQIVKGRGANDARTLLAAQWTSLRADLFGGMPVGAGLETVMAAVKPPPAAATTAALAHVATAMARIFHPPLVGRAPATATARAQALVVVIVGSSWDLAHETFARTDVKLVHGVVDPSPQWTPRDTAVLSFLGGARVKYRGKRAKQAYQVGVDGALPKAHFRLCSTETASGASGLEAALEAAIAAAPAGSLLVVPRTLERSLEDGRWVQLPLDANPAYAALLARAVQAGLLVLIAAGRSGLDLDGLAAGAPTLGKSGAKIVAAAVPDANRGRMIALNLPDEPAFAAGFDRVSVRPGAPYTDRWTGQENAVARAAALIGQFATTRARIVAWKALGTG